jgi:hypothetical protein
MKSIVKFPSQPTSQVLLFIPVISATSEAIGLGASIMKNGCEINTRASGREMTRKTLSQ